MSKSPITKVRHIMKHFFFGFLSSSGRCGPGTLPASVCLVARKARTKLVKRSSTLCAVFAEVSKNAQPKDRARACPSSLDTSLSYVLSHLFPTSIKIGFCLFTRSMDCRKTSSRSNVDRDAIEYTRMNPWPSLEYEISSIILRRNREHAPDPLVSERRILLCLGEGQRILGRIYVL